MSGSELRAQREEVIAHLMRELGVERNWAESYADIALEFYRLELASKTLTYEQVDQLGAGVGKDRGFVVKGIAALIKARLIK